MKSFFLAMLLIFIIMFIGCEKEDLKVQKNAAEKGAGGEVIELPFDTALPGRIGIENTVKAYNMALRNALISDPFLKVLRKYAIEKEVRRVYAEIQYDAQKGVAMRSWQKELLFDNISASENNGYADTSEVWVFELVDLKTKEVVEQKKNVEYKLKYTFEKENGRWVVSRLSEREPAKYTRTVEIQMRPAR